MNTFLVAIGSFLGFIIAYNTYGRFLAKRIFRVDPNAIPPSKELEDDIDFVPSKKSVVFGHHFTSIAGTGPIVGPAIAVFWGWLPALIWVLLGSVFIGAVHDFSALIISMRNRGQTVGEIAGQLINRRARLLFLLILFFALTVVLAIFGLVVASIFKIYPETVLSVWIAMPLAMLVGYWSFVKRGSLVVPSIACLLIVYLAVYVGVEYFPVRVLQTAGTDPGTFAGKVDLQIGKTVLATSLPLVNPTIAWTLVLMIYCFIASTLPVWLLLQPRDFINSQQLLVALALLAAGLAVAGLSGKANLTASAPPIVQTQDLPANTPPIFPFLFITIACGACSGFHCLVSSGTSSKQLSSECDSQFVGYGSMLLEGALAVIVILACTAGVGMGLFEKNAEGVYVPMVVEGEGPIVESEAWRLRYKQDGDFSKFSLKDSVGAFVEGGANFLSTLGLPLRFGVGIIATLVACFAATTLDSATRLQRYVIQELAGSFHLKPLQNKYGATTLAVGLGLALALLRGGQKELGGGGTILWPLFGATNQLLAGLAFLVAAFYLWRKNYSAWIVVIPMIFMLIIPGWALTVQIGGWWEKQNWLLLGFGVATLALQFWMVIEAIITWRHGKEA
ncbi:MAG: carbon starvation protein A [Pirellulaceae bacterium]